METKELIEQLRDCGTRNCPVCPEVESCTGPSLLMVKAADRLEELEKKYAAAVEMAATATELAAKYRKVDGDLISRSELMKYPIRLNHYDKVNGNEHFVFGVESVLEYAEYLPAVPAEPIVHARWKGAGLGDYLCSACWEVCSGGNRFKRCPHCGAHMDEEVADGLHCTE